MQVFAIPVMISSDTSERFADLALDVRALRSSFAEHGLLRQNMELGLIGKLVPPERLVLNQTQSQALLTRLTKALDRGEFAPDLGALSTPERIERNKQTLMEVHPRMLLMVCDEDVFLDEACGDHDALTQQWLAWSEAFAARLNTHLGDRAFHVSVAVPEPLACALESAHELKGMIGGMLQSHIEPPFQNASLH